MEKCEKVKVGIVGAGNIANSAHLPAYENCSNAMPAAICDIDFERAKKTAEKYNIEHVYSSVEEMLQKADIEAVDICTWNNGHAPVCVAAAKAGKHVLCEKPLAMNVSQALEMQKAVDDAGVIFMLAVPSRFGYENMYLRDMYEKGELGEVYYAKTSAVRRRGTPLRVVHRQEDFRRRACHRHRHPPHRRSLVSHGKSEARACLRQCILQDRGLSDQGREQVDRNSLSGQPF